MNIFSRLPKSLRWAVVLLLIGAMASACRTAASKDDQAEEIRKSQAQEASDATGLSVAAIEAFQNGLAEISKESFDLEEAVGYFAQAVQLEDSFAEAHYNLGLLYLEMDRRDTAVEHIQKARRLDPDVFDYTVALAQAYALNGQYNDAETLFSEVIARDPDNLTAKNNMAVIALNKGEEDRAMDFVREILREDNDNVGALNTLGLVYFQRDNLSLAKYVLDKAHKIEETNPDVLNNLGLVYMKEENVPAAVNAFVRAIETNPDYLESRLNLGSILIEYLDYERAHEQFTEAVRISPHHCVANLGLGATSFATGEHSDAQDRYVYYVENCDADHISSYERLAQLNEAYLNNHRQAITYYQKLLEFDLGEEKKAEYNAMVGFLQNQVKAADQKTPEPVAEDDGEE
ncbi:MAG: tetratricopeptide repeat protein [Bradymonadaceae bacterium]